MKEITFLIQCADSKGLLAGITSFFYDKNFNILSCQQHTDLYTDKYFMRIKLDMTDLKVSRKELEKSFAKFAEQYGCNQFIATKRHKNHRKLKMSNFLLCKNLNIGFVKNVHKNQEVYE